MKATDRITFMVLLLTIGMTAALMLASCSMTVSGRTGGGEEITEVSNEPGPRGSLHIPPGHLPPPGECRVWIPGRPPGHQPKAGRCDRLSGHVPPGALLLYRPESDPRHVRVTEYHPERPDVIIAIRYYVAANGNFAWSERVR